MSNWQIILLIGFILNILFFLREINDLAGPAAGSIKERISWSAIAIAFCFVPWIYPVLWLVEVVMDWKMDSEP